MSRTIPAVLSKYGYRGLDPGYVDPPLGRSVTTPEVAVAALEVAALELDEPDRLDSRSPHRQREAAA